MSSDGRRTCCEAREIFVEINFYAYFIQIFQTFAVKITQIDMLQLVLAHECHAQFVEECLTK